MDEPVATAALRERYDALPPDHREQETVTVAGRVVLKRDMGKLKFLTLRDGTGDIQLVCNQTEQDEESFTLLDEVDLGDIIGATGQVGTTRRGELSVFVETLGDADEVAAPVAGEMARAQGSRTSSSAGDTCT